MEVREYVSSFPFFNNDTAPNFYIPGPVSPKAEL